LKENVTDILNLKEKTDS